MLVRLTMTSGSSSSVHGDFQGFGSGSAIVAVGLPVGGHHVVEVGLIVGGVGILEGDHGYVIGVPTSYRS